MLARAGTAASVGSAGAGASGDGVDAACSFALPKLRSATGSLSAGRCSFSPWGVSQIPRRSLVPHREFFALAVRDVASQRSRTLPPHRQDGSPGDDPLVEWGLKSWQAPPRCAPPPSGPSWHRRRLRGKVHPPPSGPRPARPGPTSLIPMRRIPRRKRTRSRR